MDISISKKIKQIALALGGLAVAAVLSWPANYVAAQFPRPDIMRIGLDAGAAGIERSLAELSTRASLLMITAHPDDEDGGLLAAETRGPGARGALMTLTRGEGGQDAMADYLYDALGLIRTEELLQADRYYGVDQYWSNVIDYGFSKTREEALQQWGHDRVLEQVVRVVRLTRPLVIVSSFVGAPTDGHGNHQVAGEVAQEAFVAAGDPKQFPEQIKAGLRPWTPLRVYAHVPFFEPTRKGIYDYATDKYVPVRFFNYVDKTWIEGKPATNLGVAEGAVNWPSGLTFQQIGREGLSFQKSQNHGSTLTPPGFYTSQYHLYGAHLPAAATESSMFQGIDVSVASIASLAEGDTAFLQRELASVSSCVEAAKQQFRADDPAKIAPILARGLGETRALMQQVEHSRLTESGKDAVLFELRVKEQQFQTALSRTLGLFFEARIAGDPTAALSMAIPGQKLSVATDLVNTSSENIGRARVALESPLGEHWATEAKIPANGDLKAQSELKATFEVSVPEDAAFTRPYFSRPNTEQPYYDIHDPRWRNLSFAPYPLQATADLTYEGQQLTLKQYVQTLHHEASVGVQADPLMVAPAISVTVSPSAGALPFGQRSFEFGCAIHSNVKGEAKGVLRLHVPQGWHTEPAELPFDLLHDGDSQTVTLRVFPESVQARAYHIEAVAEFNGKTYSQGYLLPGYPGLRTYPLYRDAAYKATGVDVKVASDLHVAFIPGTGDDLPRALRDLGVSVTVLNAADLATSNLSQYNVIVLGVRAYAVRPELRAFNDRLLQFVHDGGTVLVQYQWQNFGGGYAPFPLTIAPRPATVVDENAPVELTDAENPVMQWPNKLSAQDFAGWVEERGHGFLQSWDPRYNSLIETHDPEQPPQKGGLLVAHYGKGIYIYDALALYRQTPEGVPGAFRLLANLISAGREGAPTTP